MKALPPPLLLVTTAAAALFLQSGTPVPGGAGGADGRSEAAPSEPGASEPGPDWTPALDWDFSRGPHPQAWGHGARKIAGGFLELTATGDEPATYVIPVAHSRNFLLEAEVQLVANATEGGPPVGAHLDTRDGSLESSVTGVALYGGLTDVFIRHDVDLRPSPGATVHHAPAAIQPGDWHILRFRVNEGRVRVHVDDHLIHAETARRATSTYAETGLSVEHGTARFRSLRVLTRPSIPAGVAPAALPGAAAPAVPAPSPRPLGVRVLVIALYGVIGMICVYMVRHYLFTLNRLFGRQRHPYLDVDTADWPPVTVLIPAHNEEPVIGEILGALLEADYPPERFHILPVNDRSEDRTAEIIDRLAQEHPGRITPFHRREGKPGKAAALQDAMEAVEDDIVLVFDADYIPGHGLIKQLVAPFFDPEVGAVMGRVVPHNVGQNLITRVLDLERAGGYQVDQQARMNLHLVPQYGGTVGGVRKGALLAAGGWRDDSLAEDTDATYRLLLAGWKIAYQNRSECYEQVPNTWPMRMRQLVRWARGHNQVMVRYAHRLIFNRRTRFSEKLDAFLLLHVYLMSPVLLLGWALGIVLWYLGVSKPGLIVVLAVTSYSTLGNFAIFFEIATAAYLDGSRERIRLLPFVLPAFLVSLVSITSAALTQVFARRPGEDVLWHKTEHNNRGHTWT